MRNHLSSTQAARIVGLAPQTLRKLKCLGGGPRCSKYAGRLWYEPAALLDWMRAKTENYIPRRVL